MADRVHWSRPLIFRGRWTAFAAWLACAATPALAAPTLTGDAGLGGHARAGRWMPVTVSVAAVESISGQLTVNWGGAVAHRSVQLPAGTARSLTFLLRTGDPRSHVDVTLASATGTASATIPVAVESDDTMIVACVGHAADAACTVTITPAQASRDWRAYDVADDVRVAAPTLDAAQRDAIARWAGRRQSESMFGAPVPRGALVAATPASRVTPLVVLVLLLPLVAAAAVRGRPRWRLATQCAAVAAAVAAAAGAGRAGAGSSLRHVTAVHAFAGTQATIAESRLAVDAVSDGVLRATLQSAGGWIERTGPGQIAQWLDDDSHAFVTLAARMGGSYRLDAEYPGPPSPVRVVRTDAEVSIENGGSSALTACVFPLSLDARGATSVPPATTLSLRGAVSPGAAVSCLWDADPPPLVGAGADVAGASTLLVHLDTVLP